MGIIADSPSPTAAAGGGRGALGSEPLDVVDLDTHIIINTDQLGDDTVRCNELPKSELTIHQLSQKATISELF